MTSQPLWLRSPAIRALLNELVSRLDRAEQRGTRAQAMALSERTWPQLYQADRESEKEALWEYLLEMSSWGWISLRPEKVARSRSGYANSPRIAVVNEREVRAAVGRAERLKTAAERWREAVYAGLRAPDDAKAAVAEYCIDLADRTMDEVVERLNFLPTLAHEPLLLREVSSRLFWGMSKVLDKRQGLVASLLGLPECPFPESPVQLQVFLPAEGYRGVLFIENLMSFERAVRSRNPLVAALALVYAAGFKGSAQRLRMRDGCSLFYSARGSLDPESRENFEAWLRGRGDQPSYFWGDLDWSGMRILTALRASFQGLQAWEPGYEAMLAALTEGRCHAPEAADKQGQRTLEVTGCPYADTRLVPALRVVGRFVDQEQVAL